MNGSNIILHNMAIQSYIIKLYRWFFTVVSISRYKLSFEKKGGLLKVKIA